MYQEISSFVTDTFYYLSLLDLDFCNPCENVYKIEIFKIILIRAFDKFVIVYCIISYARIMSSS